jgi:putative spermidine/putrescine transport system ATP-binding protein
MMGDRSATMSASIIELGTVQLVNVTKIYNDVVAVDKISLLISGGQYCCLLGPSGCGKTSTLRVIAGHELVSEGDVLIGNRNVTEVPPAQRGTAMCSRIMRFSHTST